MAEPGTWLKTIILTFVIKPTYFFKGKEIQ